MKNLFTTTCIILLCGAVAKISAQTPCSGGSAAGYPCNNVDYYAHLTLPQMGAPSPLEGSGCWGWTNTSSGREYALMGLENGTAFVEITDPANPVLIGNLPTQTVNSIWREIKTYQNYALIVSEASGHGLQIFDLNQLDNITNPPVNFTASAVYTGFGKCHNIVVNEASGYAYGVGTNTCSGGLHFVNISNPLAPVGAGCFSSDGYTHDAQCVIYEGPDCEHVGKEICICSNTDTETIVDVTNKSAPVMISRTGYAGEGYTHQGWLSDDQRYFIMNDEYDEIQFGHNTKTYLWDMSDLDAPFVTETLLANTACIDHNEYYKGDLIYQANYTCGLRILRHAANAPHLSEVAYFDGTPGSNAATFNATWNVYPYFPSGNVILGNIEEGLYVVHPNVTAGVFPADDDRDDDGYAACNPDCDDNNPNVWTSCATCIDNDNDGYYVGCDAYITVDGPDCDDTTPYANADSDNDGVDNSCDACAGYNDLLDLDSDGVPDGCDVINNCNTQYTINQNFVSGDNEYISAVNYIQATNTIDSGAVIIYNAGDYCDLLPEFWAKSGCDFHAYIQGCTPSLPPIAEEPLLFAKENNTASLNVLLQKETAATALQLQIFPNPAATGTAARVQVVSEAGGFVLNIMDIQGKKVAQWEVFQSDAGEVFSWTLPSFLQAGIYMIQVQGKNNVCSRKFVVQ